MSLRTRLMGAALAALAASCTTPGPTPDAGGVLQPPAALKMNGVEPVPQTLVRAVGGYANFRGVRLLDWQPQARGLLVAFERGGRLQLHELEAAGAPLRPVTSANEPTRSGVYVPAQPNLIVFERDTGGDEAARIYRLDLTTNVETALTDLGRRYGLGPFNQAGTALFAISVPLDRNAGGGTLEQAKSAVMTEIVRIDPVAGSSKRIAALSGTGWYVADVSLDERTLLLVRYRSATDAEVWSLVVGQDSPKRLLPREGEPAAYYSEALFAFDGSIFIVTDRDGEFRQLARFEPAGGRIEAVTGHIPWDVDQIDRSTDRRLFAIVTNEGGSGSVRTVDAATLRVAAVPSPAGASVTAIRLSPDAHRLAFAFSSSSSPSSISVVDLATRGATPWASADTAGIDTSRFGATEVISWASFDGRRVSGLITRPDATRFRDKRPVLIDIHGGPEAQARLGFLGRNNYLVNELGIVVIEPNVRGSSGFGKSFLALDDGRKREDAVRDIGSLLDWIAAQTDLDAARVAVTGGSYGGYMVHAVAVHYSDRIRAAVSVVGISHFVSFLEHTETYRRELRRAEYGDERDPDMRAFLESISPLVNAARIKVPLFVVHGRNDPRVPVGEAEQMVRTVSANGVPVWSMIADNEGHGFAKKENADYAFYARVLFLRRYLLAGS
ncbi:MAG TPA: prolyl oligopeptidase family serine peptidase [Burkholderiaceae bacterium]|nr:prolyl oligopeptidase family serine peptidase [Burkholderiaceae bacterium]